MKILLLLAVLALTLSGCTASNKSNYVRKHGVYKYYDHPPRKYYVQHNINVYNSKNRLDFRTH